MLLITGRLSAIDPTRLIVGEPWVPAVLEIAGLAAYVLGFLLMAGALITLGRHYQPGGSTPRSEDRMITGGPFRWIRHPMYTAAICISAGLTCLTQSGACLCLLVIHVTLILMLIPVEEAGLARSFRESYTAYSKATRKLIPFVY